MTINEARDEKLTSTQFRHLPTCQLGPITSDKYLSILKLLCTLQALKIPNILLNKCDLPILNADNAILTDLELLQTQGMHKRPYKQFLAHFPSIECVAMPSVAPFWYLP